MFALSGSVSCRSPWPLLHKVLRLGGGFRLTAVFQFFSANV